MKNRIPIIALGALFLIAVIWRLANPPKPKPPGPTGSFPGWRSSAALGELGAYAVNPGGTRWAGAWNETDTRTNRLRSMMWIIDFGARTAVGHEFSAGTLVSSVTWADDNTVRALTVDSENPASADQSKIVYVDAISGDEKRRSHPCLGTGGKAVSGAAGGRRCTGGADGRIRRNHQRDHHPSGGRRACRRRGGVSRWRKLRLLSFRGIGERRQVLLPGRRRPRADQTHLCSG